MALIPGIRLGPYEIIAPIGEGGMGQVYRAHDTKLNRDVALKVLPELFVNDPDRLARFQREAQVLASLNHPNIAHIHGLEDSGGVRALVMELVDGEDLAQRLTRGAIPIDETLPIAKQMAAALEAAHEQGIIHRDLKPANIKVRGDGTVKVLDFGLAKAMEAPTSAMNVSQSPTITTPAMTQAGMILGTAAYMSPEQAKGRPADKRSDIWAFGCVIYELLAGKRAFEGDDVSDTLAAVLRGQPDWTALPVDVPEHIRLLLHRCLEKDRSKRVSDVGVAQFLMTESSLATGSMSTPPPPPARPWWTRLAPIAASAFVGAAIVGASLWELRPQPAPPVVTRFALRIPDDQRFTNVGREAIAISPDGTRIAYVANQRLQLKAMWDVDVRPLTPQAPGGLTTPVFSPDSQWIAYWAAPGVLNKIAITGGAPVKLSDADNPYGMSWTGDSLLVGQGPKGIVRVRDGGGAAEVVIKVNDDEIANGPQLLPDGRSVLFTLASGTDAERWDKAQIVAQAIGSTERKTIVKGGADGRVLRSGHLVYAVGGVLFAVPFDARKLETVGGPVPVVEGVSRSTGLQTGAAHFAVSHTGTLAYIAGPAVTGVGESSVSLLDPQGRVERLKLPPHNYQSPRFSPNGQQLVLGLNDGRTANILVADLDNHTQPRQLTFGSNNRFPIWTPDGTRITFQSDRENDRSIFWQSADGKGSAEVLMKAEHGESLTPESWSPDGDTLLFTSQTGTRQYVLNAFTRHDKRRQPFANVQSTSQTNAGFSRDGRWVVYSIGAVSGSDNGVGTVYVRPFPATDEVHLIGPGVSPFWARDTMSLYFVANPGVSAFSVVNITTEPRFGATEPSAVSRPAITGGGPNLPRAYDVAPDGKHLVVLTASDQPGTVVAGQIQFVLNWFQELKSRVPTK